MEGGGRMPDYELIRSNRRTLALEVRDGTVRVRAPRRVSRAEIDAFVQSHAAWIERSLARQQVRRDAHPEPDETQRAEYIRRAKEILPGRVAYYANVMGLRPAGVTITSARTRFGSCSSKGRLCFSWRLMQWRIWHTGTTARHFTRSSSATCRTTKPAASCCGNKGIAGRF